MSQPRNLSDAKDKTHVLALRGSLVYFLDDPFLVGTNSAFVYESDGIVICRGSKIEAVGNAQELFPSLPSNAELRHFPGCLISAGFIDTHVHYVQTGIIGSFGEKLLEWLDNYTFVAEQAFSNGRYARAVASIFCDQLLANGTTSALVFCAVYPQSVDALFAEAEARNMRIIAGKVLMDRNAPEPLLDTAQSAYDDSKALISRWHGKGRSLYAITPRFAPTSTPEQLELAGALWKESPTTFVQSHISENRDEVAWVKELFPQRKGYLDVYDHFGLVGPRSVMAHGIYLTEAELCTCHARGVAIAHCPTSNLFLGSGLFDIKRTKDPRRPVHVGMGTDIGAGTSFSMLTTLNEAYKVAKLNSYPLDSIKSLFLATLGGARSLGLEDKIGSIQPGLEADLVVLDPSATPLLKFRSAQARSIEEQLFVLMTLGDDRSVKATFVAGELRYERKE
jgi:guanine deaminase